MKKIFCGIGILIATFSVYFFLLYADKQVYVNDSCVYDVVLSETINGEQLEEYAKNANVMIQLLEHKNVSFGKTDIEIVLINPEKMVQSGRQRSIFPKSNIVYVTNPPLSELVIADFVIQTGDEKKVDIFCDELEKAGYFCEVYNIGKQGFSFGMLFSELNLKFFLMIFILTILSIIMYYIYRLKEIGILCLNGWSAVKVSVQIMTTMMYITINTSLIFVVPFAIYIVALNNDLFVDFLYTYCCKAFYNIFCFF